MNFLFHDCRGYSDPSIQTPFIKNQDINYQKNYQRTKKNAHSNKFGKEYRFNAPHIL